MAYPSLIPEKPHYAYVRRRDDLLLVFEHLARKLEPEKKKQDASGKKKRRFSGPSACKALIVDILDFRARYVLAQNLALKETEVWDPITVPELAFQLRQGYSEDVIARCIQEMLVEGSWTDVEGEYGKPGHIYQGTLLRRSAGINSYAYQLHYPVLRGLVAALPSESPFNVWQRRKWPEKKRGKVLRKIGGLSPDQESSEKSVDLAKSPPKNRGTIEHKSSEKSEAVLIYKQHYTEYSNNNSPDTTPEAPAGAVVDLLSLYPGFLDELALRSWNLPSVYVPAIDLPGSTPQWNMALLRAVAATYLLKPPFRPSTNAWKEERAEWEQALIGIYQENAFRLSGIVEVAYLMKFMQDPGMSGWAEWMQKTYPQTTLHPKHVLANWRKCLDEMHQKHYAPALLTVGEEGEEAENDDSTVKMPAVKQQQREEEQTILFPSSPVITESEPEEEPDLTPGLSFKDMMELRKEAQAAYSQAKMYIRSVRPDGSTDLGFRLFFSLDEETWYDFRSFEEWHDFQTQQTFIEVEGPFSTSEAS